MSSPLSPTDGIAGVVLTARTAGATDDNGTTLPFPALALAVGLSTLLRRCGTW
jgi:hypothetical protein